MPGGPDAYLITAADDARANSPCLFRVITGRKEFSQSRALSRRHKYIVTCLHDILQRAIRSSVHDILQLRHYAESKYSVQFKTLPSLILMLDELDVPCWQIPAQLCAQ